ncbi:ribosomal protein S18-alanine N-acetyltransferase [Anaerostipes sp. MSJ-23]|uniref:ribosomal protein S18-alanine N-acetyltransferase n=1 Tax=Anaerostipes sp. MSJ-23 TaxID=2841520 RepID=UPI00209EEA70|nr:ribosomal protein S18-alanine N-acetyltransferase [Anaerostipes sp. MSJ-23]
MERDKQNAREWHVHKAQPQDLPMIAEIEKLSFHKPWSEEGIESFYYKKTSDIYVWRDRNRISGYIMAEHILEQGELQRIAIVPFIRSMGIGTLFLQEFRERYRKMGVETIYLEVRESNNIARNFYKKNGFEEHGRRPKYYTNPMEDAILMFWDDPNPLQTLPVETTHETSYNESCKEDKSMLCNVCGNPLKEKSDFIEVKKEWGYFSDKDTQIHEFKICERCYDRMIKQFEIPPRVTEKKEILS